MPNISNCHSSTKAETLQVLVLSIAIYFNNYGFSYGLYICVSVKSAEGKSITILLSANAIRIHNNKRFLRIKKDKNMIWLEFLQYKYIQLTVL